MNLSRHRAISTYSLGPFGSLIFHGFPTILPFVTASRVPSGLGPGNPVPLLSLPQGKKILPTYHGQQTNKDLQLQGQMKEVTPGHQHRILCGLGQMAQSLQVSGM